MEHTGHPDSDYKNVLTFGFFLLMTAAILAYAKTIHYLLFHTIGELVAITVSFSIFVLTWTSLRYLKNNYLLIIGSAYGTIGMVDIFHTLTFKGMQVLPSATTNHPTQFWLTARFIEAVALLVAPLLFSRSVGFLRATVAFAMLGAIGIWATLHGLLPATYVDGVGLSDFKIYSEYLIIFMLVAGLGLLWRIRSDFALTVFRLLVGSVIFAIITEICFVQYVSFYDYINEIGHYFRFLSVVMAFLAIVVTGIQRPADLMFRQLAQSELHLQQALKFNQAVLQESPLAIGVYRASGPCVLANEAYAHLLGSSRGELLAQNYHHIKAWQDSDVMDDCRAALADGMQRQREFRARSSFGKDVWVNCQILPTTLNGEPHLVMQFFDLSEIRATSQQLSSAMKRLELATKAANIGIWVWDLGSNAQTWDERLLQLYQVPADVQASGISHDFWKSRCHPDDLARVESELAATIHGGIQYDSCFRIVLPDGQIRHIKSAAVVEHDDQNQPKLVVGINRDVTDAVLAGERLSQSEAQFRELFERNHSVMLLIEPSTGRIVSANQAAVDFYGHSQQALISMNIDDINTLAPERVATERKCAVNKRSSHFNFVHRLASGELRDVEVYVTPIGVDGSSLLFSIIHDVTQRRTAERAEAEARTNLAAREEVLQKIQDTVSVGIFLVDNNGLLTHANRRMEEMFRIDSQSLIGSEYVSLIHPQEREIGRQNMLKLLSSEINSVNLERLYWRHDGTQFWGRLTGRRFSGPSGDDIGLVGSIDDITEHKYAIENLSAAKSRLEAAASAGIVGIWDWDIPNNRLIWDSVMYQLYGIREQDWGAAYDAWASAIHPDDKTYTEGEIQAALRGERQYAPEFRVIWPDGSIHHIKAASHTTFDEFGKPLRMIGVNYDMTEFKNIQHLLEEKMQLLGTILDNSSVGITFVQNRRLIWSNQRMGDIFGYTQAEMTNQSTRMFFPSQESYEELGRLGYKTLARGESFISEREMRRKDGSIAWTRLSGKSVDTANLDLGSIWVFEDIAQQKQTQMQLEAAKESAEAANLSKSRFLATMSHEIRTPMNGILGMAQMLLMPDLKEDRRGDYARTILSSGQTLLILLNDILDLSKIEAGKFQLESTAFAPETMMHETTNLFAGAVQTKGLQLDCQWQGASGQRYLADSHRLRQMLSNLVGNAIKFTRAGQVRIEASEVECTDSACVLEFAVSDTGIGIPADKLDLLFKPFSQADSSTTREFGGTGLGLSIVRNLALAMHGDVGVSSQPGHGSRFWFRVQVQRITETQDSRKSERLVRVNNHADSDLSTTSLCGHVLVAEDNQVNCMVIESLLNSLGITVSVVHDGQQSVEFMARACSEANGDQPKCPDLILMDLHMPEMDGYVATQRIRQWEADNQHARLPIIALTADAFEEDRQRCLAIGMDAFLSKPIALEALRSALAKWLPAGLATPVAAKPPLSLKPVDMEAFTALVTELTPLLHDNKFTAINRFKSLQNLVKNTHLAEEIETLASMLQEMRFDQVLARLRLICLNCAAIDNRARS